ncbi:MAG: hypothetical protein E3J91_00670, partial [Hadesarchaea archaeon]
MGYSWTKLIQDEFGRKGAKQSFALALIVMMFAGVFAFILPSLAAADSWTDTITENFALGTHENTENVDNNVRLENIGVGIYYTQGRFTSQAFDAGQVVDNWDNILWSVTLPTLTKYENDNVGVEPTTLVDGSLRIGTVVGGSLLDIRDSDGVYDNIAENDVGGVTSTSYYPSGYNLVGSTTYVSGSVSDLASNNGVYMILRSYDTSQAGENTYPVNEYFDDVSDWSTTYAPIQGTPTYGQDTGSGVPAPSYYHTATSTAAKAANIVFETDNSFSYTAGTPTSASLKWSYSLGGNSIDTSGNELSVRLVKPGSTEVILDSVALTGATSWTSRELSIGVDNFNENGIYTLRLYSHLVAGAKGATKYVQSWWDNIILRIETPPTSQYTVSVEFTGASNTASWSQLEWNVDSAWTTGSVDLLLQLWNYELGRYSQSGEDGYISYTSSATANTDELKTQTITTSPTNFRDASGNWKLKVTGVKNTSTQFDLKADLVEFKPTWQLVDYALRWGHRIENVATDFDNYIVKVRGYTSGDGENVGVYLWKSSTSSWEFIDNLDNIGPKTVTKFIAGSSISDYLVGDNLCIKYEDWDNTDDNQTTLHIDLCIVEQQGFFETGIKLQVRVSADGTTWTENLGPSGTSSDYFVSQSGQNVVSLENIPDNRYIQYIAYSSSEDSTITPVLHEVTINYTPRPPTKPVLYLPENGSQISDNTPYFEWTAGAGATYHRLQIDNDSNFSSPIYDNSNLGGNENSIEIENELPPDNYWWRVAAGNVRGENWSENTWTFEVLEVINHAPTAPSSPWCEGATNPTGVIDLTPEFSAIYEDPDAEDQAIYYEIEVNTQSDFLGTSMWDTGKTSMSPLTAGNRSADVGYAGDPLSLDGYQYFWRIRFWDDDNAQGAWSATQNFTMKDETPPSVPTDLSVVTKAGAEGTLVITWTAPPEGDVQGYQLWFSTDNITFTLESDQAGTTYTDTGLTDGSTYYYKVSAYDEVPNYSDNCAVVSGVPVDDLAPSVPTDLSVVTKAGAEGTLVITWTAPTEGDLQGYKL